MNGEKLNKVIEKVREVGCSNFDELASYTNTDHGKLMVVFAREPGHTRKINDWGRDEDTEIFIGLSNEGWIRYYNIHEIGAGPTVLKEENSIKIKDEDIINLLKELSIEEYLRFMGKCNKLKEKYYIRF